MSTVRPTSPTTALPAKPANTLRATIQAYYHLTKPGIIYGNLVSALGGFLFASQGTIDWLLGLAVLGGTALIIASGCVLNNYIDRGIDAKMARTKERALVKGTISENHAFLYAAILSLLGFGILAASTNILTVYIGLAGLYCYVVAYGFAKRKGPIGTIVGSFSGSAAITAGYTAVTGQLDGGAVLIFLAMAYWQMPHFYAIAIFRLKDYKNAGLPVLPAVKGIPYTKFSIMAYIVMYAITASLLTVFGYTTYYFFVLMLAFNAVWFWKGIQGLKGFKVGQTKDKPQDEKLKDEEDDTAWARKMFGFSLIVMMSFSVLLGIDSFIH